MLVRDMQPSAWIERACAMVTRNRTRAEWMQYFPSEDYRATCPQRPLEP